MSNSQTIVLVGARGFLGRSLQPVLMRQGQPLISASSSDCDLLDINAVSSFFQAVHQPFLVVLCAGISRRKDDSIQAMSRNLTMTENLIQAVSASPCQGVAFMSTADVYGRAPALPITETTPTAPCTYYGWGKRIAEQRLSESLKCPVLSLRIPGTYGVEDLGQSAIGRLAHDAKTLGKVSVYGKPHYRQDFIPIDLLAAVVTAWTKKPMGGVLNLATGHSHTMAEWARFAADAIGQETTIEQIEDRSRPASDYVFDNTQLRARWPMVTIDAPPASVAAYVSGLERRPTVGSAHVRN